jgi:molybdenum-dependent DNA-binding transcriptional regulator ModE
MTRRGVDPAGVLTLDALQLLDAIARRGSFAAAAAELGRVPSAITYAVRKLEDDLDVLLFDRRGYRAQLTAAGEELLREGRSLLLAADELTRRVQRVADGWERELRIALDTIIPFERLLPLIDGFCGVAPTQLRITHNPAASAPATRRSRWAAWRWCLPSRPRIRWRGSTDRCRSRSCAGIGRSWWATRRAASPRVTSASSAPPMC